MSPPLPPSSMLFLDVSIPPPHCPLPAPSREGGGEREELESSMDGERERGRRTDRIGEGAWEREGWSQRGTKGSLGKDQDEEGGRGREESGRIKREWKGGMEWEWEGWRLGIRDMEG